MFSIERENQKIETGVGSHHLVTYIISGYESLFYNLDGKKVKIEKGIR